LYLTVEEGITVFHAPVTRN